MEYINIERLQDEKKAIRDSWNAKKPFRYLYLDNFLFENKAEELLGNYPDPWKGEWNNTTYINQKNKFQKTKFEQNDCFDKVFKELNSPEFLSLMSEITGIEDLLPDADLFGGGLHQSINGAFLDVHIDYNIHPKTKDHRRLNILVYMNKDWKDEYNGQLELWDLTTDPNNKKRLEKISPIFNRMAMFETNQISYHGHPHPLKTPEGVNRKSMAAYYYSKTRPQHEIADEHNTVYVNTTGVNGKVKNLFSGIKAFFERLKK